MAEREITYSFDGQSYTGHYDVVGYGEASAVSVRFDRNSISATVGQLGPEIVARTLLGELVREKLSQDDPAQASSDAGRRDDEPLRYRYGPLGGGSSTPHQPRL